MWFGVFQAGIAYSDLKVDCGGGAQHAKFPFADRIRAGIPRGWEYGLSVSTRRGSFIKRLTDVCSTLYVYDGGARPRLEVAS